MREKDILVKSDGAEIIEFDDDNIPNVIIVKSNGTSTYIVRDIATALYRKRNYDFFKNIYVVGGEQNFTSLSYLLYFKKWVMTLVKTASIYLLDLYY